MDAKHDNHPHVIAHAGYDLFNSNKAKIKKILSHYQSNLLSVVSNIRIEQYRGNEYELKQKIEKKNN